MAIIVRKENPPKFKSYKRYKPYLRKDFNYSCAYCSIHEGEYGSFHNFACEHFKPKSKIEFRHLKNDYGNLLYSCQTCNRLKSDMWPSDTLTKEGYFFLNPCEFDYDGHFEMNNNNFEIIPKSKAATYMIEKIHLNRQQLIQLRKMRFLEKKIDEKFHNLSKLSNSDTKRKIENLHKTFQDFNEIKYNPLSEEDMK
ncbi:MAG: HNH endonuclease [Euryarchaeota archaeon]|nr:HNH endonuclease [Euryarchaeota archaeon]